MCNHYLSPDEAAVERAWHIGNRTPLKWPAEVVPRRTGLFLRSTSPGTLDLVVGLWSLIPHWSEEPRLKFSTNNARSEEVAIKPSYKDAWRSGQRCIIPAASFLEPNWETGRNIWWQFRRTDGLPWGLAGLYHPWLNKQTGEIVESYTMLTVNADDHPLMSRMHKPDPTLPPDQQDKRSVIAIEPANLEQWLWGTPAEARELFRPPAMVVIEAGPV